MFLTSLTPISCSETAARPTSARPVKERQTTDFLCFNLTRRTNSKTAKQTKHKNKHLLENKKCALFVIYVTRGGEIKKRYVLTWKQSPVCLQGRCWGSISQTLFSSPQMRRNTREGRDSVKQDTTRICSGMRQDVIPNNRSPMST